MQEEIMIIANIHEAKTHLSSFLAQVERSGEKVLVCRNGKPIAEIVAHKQTNRLNRHPVMGNIEINYDPVESLSEEEWAGEKI